MHLCIHVYRRQRTRSKNDLLFYVIIACNISSFVTSTPNGHVRQEEDCPLHQDHMHDIDTLE